MATMQPAIALQTSEKVKQPNLHSTKRNEEKENPLFEQMLALLKEDEPSQDMWRRLLLQLGENLKERKSVFETKGSEISISSQPNLSEKVDRPKDEKSKKLLASLLHRDFSSTPTTLLRQHDDETINLTTLLRKDRQPIDTQSLSAAKKEATPDDELRLRTLLSLRATRKELDALRSIQHLKSGNSVGDLRQWAKRAGLKPKLIRYIESNKDEPIKNAPNIPTKKLLKNIPTLSLPTSRRLLREQTPDMKKITTPRGKIDSPIKRLAKLLQPESTPKDTGHDANLDIHPAKPPKTSSTLLADLLFAKKGDSKRTERKTDTLHALLSQKSNQKEATALSDTITRLIAHPHRTPTDQQEAEISTISAQTQKMENSTENSKESKMEPTLHSQQPDAASLKREILDAKATVRHFARTLQEQVENYKPPFSRMQLSLDPKELGSVEVTLVSRGNQLHIQLHSNPTAIGVMATQGQELKQQLVNMGFTDVQMQFNMNQQRQQQHKQPKTVPEGYLEVEEIPDFYESLDLIIPHYV